MMGTTSAVTFTGEKHKPTVQPSMFTVHGDGVVDGVAIGRVVGMGTVALEVPHYYISSKAIESEVTRLEQAIKKVQSDLQQQIDSLPQDAPRELEPLLTVHRLLLSDPLLVDKACNLIRQQNYNAEWALTTQGQQLTQQFSAIDDTYLREREADVRQVVERVLMILTGNGEDLVHEWPKILSEEELIVVARDISPGDMLRLRQSKFAAFVTDLGGATSHTAIIARSMGIPAIVGVGDFHRAVQDGDVIIVDGHAGVVIVNPAKHVLEEYRQKKQYYIDKKAQLQALRDASAQTLDGVLITLETNIELPFEAKTSYEAGADGIGLFRSEFLFLGRSDLPTEQEQYQA